MAKDLNRHGIQDCVVIAKGNSTSGKYFIFYGQHYIQGKTCYDVGWVNKATGEICRRHYTGDEAKEISMACWSEFRDSMTAPAQPQETDEHDPKRFIN